MKLWGSNPPVEPIPVRVFGELDGWPKMADVVTKSQMLTFAQKRHEALNVERRQDVETYEARLAEWEVKVAEKLAERIPQMVELLKRSPYGISWGQGFDRDEGMQSLFADLNPPHQPDKSDYWANQYALAIGYLESIDGDELTPTTRLILQRLGCSAD